jgi:hypothetical protein
MKILLVTFWLTCITVNVIAQIKFVKVFPNPNYFNSYFDVLSAQQTNDNGYILTAQGQTQSMLDDIYLLIKTDSFGQLFQGEKLL